MNLDLKLMLYTKTSEKWIMDLKVNIKLKLLEGNIGEHLWNLGLEKSS